MSTGAHVQQAVGPAQGGNLTPWVVWVAFAGLVFVAAGLINVGKGLVALVREEFYVVSPDGLPVPVDYVVWGAALIVLGALMAMAGAALLTGATWARVVCVLLALVDLFIDFALVSAYPGWMMITIALDAIVIYALIVHGGEIRKLTENHANAT